jgi:glutaredoxin 3
VKKCFLCYATINHNIIAPHAILLKDSMDDVEVGDVGVDPPSKDGGSDTSGTANSAAVVVLSNVESFTGSSVTEKVEDCIQNSSVVVISKSWCPFSKDAIQFLSEQLGVHVKVLHVDQMKEGGKIFKYLSGQYNHHTVPMIFVKGTFLGGCDEIKALHEKGVLERDHLQGLMHTNRIKNTDTVETSKLLPPVRGQARMPFFWFPNVVNNNIIRGEFIELSLFLSGSFVRLISRLFLIRSHWLASLYLISD